MSNKSHSLDDEPAGEAEKKAELRLLQLAALCHEAQVEGLYWKTFAEAARPVRGKEPSSKGLKGLRRELQQIVADARILTARVETARRELARLRRAGEDIATVAVSNRADADISFGLEDQQGEMLDTNKAARRNAKVQAVKKAARSERPPRVSVIVPVYNKVEFVRDALESVLSQSYEHLEVVAVDDGSSDGSDAVVDKMAPKFRNLVVIHQDNRGPGDARNAGIAMATGDYVFCHDADDLMEPEAVAKLAAVAHAHGSDVVGGVFRRKIQQRQFVETLAFQETAYNLDFKSNTQKAFQYSTNISACNKMFSRSFLSRHRLKFTPGMQMEDIDLWLRVMFLSDNISQTEHVVSTYVQREGSLSGVRSEKRFESLFDLVDGLIEYYDVQGWRQFAPMRNHALIQGAINFFLKWKLEEFDGTTPSRDLLRLQTLLQRLPTCDLASFFVRKNKGPIAAVFLLARAGEFAAAKAVSERTDARGFRKLLDANPDPQPDDIAGFGLDLVNWNRTAVSA